MFRSQEILSKFAQSAGFQVERCIGEDEVLVLDSEDRERVLGINQFGDIMEKGKIIAVSTIKGDEILITDVS